MALKLTAELKAYMVEHHGLPETASEATGLASVQAAIEGGQLDPAKLAELTKQARVKAIRDMPNEVVNEILITKGLRMSTSPDPTKAFSGAGGGSVSVKDASGLYNTTKSIRKDELGREHYVSSQLEHAKAGVLFKHSAMRSGVKGVYLTEHEKSLMNEMFNDLWCGEVGGRYEPEINGMAVKTLLSDTLSGGIEVNPIWFDSNLITFPLLSGELLPLVDLQEVPRGSSIEGASVGNPTVQWGTNSGTAISLFDTTSLIQAINSTIHTVTCAVEVGRDLLSDSPAMVGRVLEANVGQRLAHELDKVIAIGTGSQPEGITTASGVAGVLSAGGAGTAIELEDLLNLIFAVEKQYRAGSSRCAFLANDETYSRAHSIANDPATPSTDQRLVLGMDVEGYNTLGRPFRIQNDVANTLIMFANFSRYRLYRRLGFTMDWTWQDAQSMRRNIATLIVRGRFAGQLMDAGAASKISDAAA